MAAALRDPIRREGKCFEGLKGALKPCEFTAFYKVRLDFVDETAQTVGVIFHAAKIGNNIEPSFFQQNSSFFLVVLLFFLFLQSGWFANS